MRVRFLGTAAAEAIPSLWCECDFCRRVRLLGGREIRRRCAYLIDDDILVDPGPDLLEQSRLFGIDWAKLRRIVVTHAHSDHLAIDELEFRAFNFAAVGHDLELIASPVTKELIEERLGRSLEDLRLVFRGIAPGGEISDCDFSVHAVRAHHAAKLDPMIYLLERGGKRFLLCNDSGLIPAAELSSFAGIAVDAVSVDCTGGFTHQQMVNHNGTENALNQLEFFRRIGCVTPATRKIVNHFSHNGNALHRELVDFFTPHGVEVAYDGWEITL